MKIIKVKKGQIIQRPGEKNNLVYKVNSGLLRSYSIDENGKEHIYTFAPENWVLVDGVPFDKECNLFIDALEDSILTPIEKSSDILKDTNKLTRHIEVLQNRIIKLMSTSAIERYEDFLKMYPNIIQRIPQRMIASFLGITPEALSSVKSKNFKK